MKGKKWIALMTVASLATPAVTAYVGPASAYAALPMLKVGSTGTYVTTLQKTLNAKGFSCGTPDGVFGYGTQTAVMSFQKAHHLTADGVVGSATWSALGISDSSDTRKMYQTEIWLNDKLISSPMGFVNNGTMYVPIWYVQHAFDTLNIQSQWDGSKGIWNMVLPPTISPDFNNPPIDLKGGNLQIQLNGKVVKQAPGLVYKDPATGYKTSTMYMPIWYVMDALNRIGVTMPTAWDGMHWRMEISLTFTAYQKDGTKLGDYTSLDQAKAAIAQMPGALIRDQSGAIKYQTPDFVAYSSPTSKLGDFLTQQDAMNSIASTSNGYIVDAIKNLVVQFPQNYFYIDSTGKWASKLSGVTGAPVPTFAKTGYKYYANPSNANDYYLLATADNHYSGQDAGKVENPFQTVDLRALSPSSVTASQIDTWLNGNNSPLEGLGADYLRAQNTYGVNATYLLSHSILETGWGTSSIYQQKNNLFGYGAFDQDPGNFAGIFPSSDYAIQYEAWIVRKNYLEPTGLFYSEVDGPTLDGMNHKYATDPNWSSSIARIMNQYVANTNGSLTSYQQYQPGSPAPKPMVTDEPAYLMNGATGTVQKNAYTNLPVFADPSTGADQMFPGNMQLNSSGRGVQLMQQKLGVTADGAFGPITQNALKSWQTGHGVPSTGICDIGTWLTMYPAPSQSLPVGTPVVIDQMKQGLVGGVVTEWDHVTGNNISGWVDSHGVLFTNMYRLQTSSGYNANVYSSANRSTAAVGMIHKGDYVVTNTPTPNASGMISIQWVNPVNGQRMTAWLDGSAASLTKIQGPATVQ